MARLYLLICICCAQITNSFGQTKLEFDTLKLQGHWTVCTSLEFLKNFNCDKGYVTYEFFEDGTFKDPRSSVDGGVQHLFSLGKWTLKDSILTIDYDDTKFSQSPPRSLKIVFLTRKKFYSIGQEGKNGPTVYTYFQKID